MCISCILNINIRNIFFVEHSISKKGGIFTIRLNTVGLKLQRFFDEISISRTNSNETYGVDLQLGIQATFHVYMFHQNSFQKSKYFPKTAGAIFRPCFYDEKGLFFYFSVQKNMRVFTCWWGGWSETNIKLYVN